MESGELREVAVGTMPNEALGRVIAQTLEGEGIPTRVVAGGGVGSSLRSATRGVRLLVRREDERRAREILDFLKSEMGI